MPLLDFEFEVHRAGFSVGNAQHDQIARGGGDINVTFGAIKIFDHFDVLGQSLGSEDIADIHRQSIGTEFKLSSLDRLYETDAIGDFVQRKNFVARELNRANFVLGAFIDDDTNDHRSGTRVDNLHVFDFEIDVAMVAVKLGELLPVLLELFVLEHAAAGDPGKHPMSAGLNHLAEFSLLESGRADELDIGNSDLGTLSDLEGSGGAPAFLDHTRDGLDGRRRIARLLVHLLDFLAIGE